MNERPRVGLGVLVVKDNKVLLGKRKNAHGSGSWAPAGGHLEFGESFEHCAQREVLEETGLLIDSSFVCAVTNDIFQQEQKHYISIFMLAVIKQGTPVLKEPEKCDEWQWFSWQQLPTPLFVPLHNLVRSGFDLEVALEQRTFFSYTRSKKLQEI